MLKILITGARGQLGFELQRCVPVDIEVFAFSRDEFNILNEELVEKSIQTIKPDVVVNAAAYTAVDKAESDVDNAEAVNTEAVKILAKACQDIGAKLIHISTDFVFDGAKSTPYMPDNATNPLSVYGSSKRRGELLALEYCSNSVVIRTSWVYSAHGRNFVKTMLNLMSQRSELNIVADQIGSPTCAQGLAEMIYKLIEIDLPSGVYHYSDLGVASWYDFACAIHLLALQKGLNVNEQLTIHPITEKEYPTPARRPKFSLLDKSDLLSVNRSGFKHWLERLSNMLDEIQQISD